MKIFRRLDLGIACLALAVLIVVTIAGVIMRYYANNPLRWTEEMQLFCFVWVVFPGAAWVARDSGHIAIDAFIGLFPAFLRKFAFALCQLVTIATMSFFAFYAWRHVQQMYTSWRVTNILGIPYCIIYLAVPLSAMVMIGIAIANLLGGQPAVRQTGRV